MTNEPVAKWLASLRRPAVIAHRGASRRAPENSLAALRIAAELGADGVEFDVLRCGSGELVVFHDRTLGRCTGALGAIGETPLSRLRTLDLDRVDRAVTGQARGERIPTLDEWLDAVPAGLFLNLEAKVDVLRDASTGAECAAALRARGWTERAVLSSFHPAALWSSRAVPELSRGALVEEGAGWRLRLAAGTSSGVASVHPPAALVTRDRVEGWHRAGWRVLVWTVDRPEEIERCLDAGVDGIITNVPDVARPLCERFRRA